MNNITALTAYTFTDFKQFDISLETEFRMYALLELQSDVYIPGQVGQLVGMQLGWKQ